MTGYGQGGDFLGVQIGLRKTNPHLFHQFPADYEGARAKYQLAGIILAADRIDEKAPGHVSDPNNLTNIDPSCAKAVHQSQV